MTSHHSSVPSIEVELSISARLLLESDASPKPDPLCVVFNHPFGRGWQEYARTEILRDVLNPDFHNKIKIHYCFEEQQKLKFQMFDTDSCSHSLSKHTYLGKVQCTLADIVTVQAYTADIMLNGVKRGQLIITVMDVSHNREELELIFSASHLRKSGLSFSLPDPFLDILSSKKTLMKRTTYLSSTKNPVWPAISVPFRVLRNNRGEYKQLTLQCYHYCKDGHHQLLGETEIHARQLLEAPASFPLKKSHSSKAVIELTTSKTKRVHSFLDYISSGTKLHFTFAIDFTDSNGDPHNPTSLHHIGRDPTQYELAMRAIGDVIQGYTGEMFSLLNFGARSAPVSHELHVRGVEGVINAYRSCLHSIQLGQTGCLSPPIEHVARSAKKHLEWRGLDCDDYFVLVILTCREIADTNQVAKAITEASELPMSVLIVGIGPTSFTSVTRIEEDIKKLSQNGRNAARDVVQYAQFNEILEKYDVMAGGFQLAKQLLADIPEQLVAYMKMKGILPKKKEILCPFSIKN
ncbi:hypothetical protein GHT06_005470 [Daphnia sinensis]|uniref:C2 domain-containing protein n=1 Tax=Daphnia sinensis TaxID=1820382 RepID=A0AAD5KTA8_9CRUS|nr:hypothetical protein GHT06_005470 [Daphnia sinensis]